VRTYTEAASRAISRYRTEPEQREPPPLAPRGTERGPAMTTLPARQLSPVPPGKSRVQSVVVHGVPTHRKIGEMWGWLQEDNPGVDVRWLVKEEARRGKARSSLVVHLNSCKTVARLWMGKRCYQNTRYDWDRKGGVLSLKYLRAVIKETNRLFG